MRGVMSSEPEAQSGSAEDVGARLRDAREARQITLREIAATTKISISALEALEQNDVARLPGGIFTRAFVRSYASEVGLDPEQTMRDFVAQVPAEEVVEERKPDPGLLLEHDLFQSQRRMVATVLTLVVVGGPLAALLLFLGLRDVPTTTDAGADSVAAAEQRLPPPPRSGEPAPLKALAAPDALAIVLRPRDDCWVSLTVDGELVFARVMRAGERESYQADDEIILNLGDAGAFDFAINERDGRSLGGAGEVASIRITHQNYRRYLVP